MENQNKKKTWYYDDTIVLMLIFLIVFTLYTIGVAVFISKSDEKTVGAFEAITGISGLILSFGTVYYVVKTYQAQKQQIRMQENQIRIQQEEILGNKKDLEFNRKLDIIYRQLEYSNIIFKKIEDQYHERIKFNASINYVFSYTISFDYIFKQLIEQLKFYVKLIDNELFQNKDKEILYKIVMASTNPYILALYNRFTKSINLSTDMNELKKQYNEYIVNKYLTKINFRSKAAMETNEKQREELILEENATQIVKEKEYFDALLIKFEELQILISKLQSK